MASWEPPVHSLQITPCLRLTRPHPFSHTLINKYWFSHPTVTHRNSPNKLAHSVDHVRKKALIYFCTLLNTVYTQVNPCPFCTDRQLDQRQYDRVSYSSDLASVVHAETVLCTLWWTASTHCACTPTPICIQDIMITPQRHTVSPPPWNLYCTVYSVSLRMSSMYVSLQKCMGCMSRT